MMASLQAHKFLLDWVSDHVPPVPVRERPKLAQALASQCLADIHAFGLTLEDVKEAAGCDLVELMRDALDMVGRGERIKRIPI